MSQRYVLFGYFVCEPCVLYSTNFLICIKYCCVTFLVECYDMVLAVVMSVPENVWDECYCTVLVSYTSVTVVTSWLLLRTSEWLNFTPHIVFTEYLGNQTRIKMVNYAFYSTTKANKQKYSIFTGVDIVIFYAWYIDNRDLQSCQVGQGKDVALTTPVQSTLCIPGHQAVLRLASGLDTMWHTSSRCSD